MPRPEASLASRQITVRELTMRTLYPGHHVAQANIARGLGSMDDPVMRGFVEQLDAINALADMAPGFVWRLQTEDGDATAVRVFDDPLLIVNLSVWESVEDLFRFAFDSPHREPLMNRKQWFGALGRPHSVLWWIPAGHEPTVDEMKERLDRLRDQGPGPDAFTFAVGFDPSGEPLERPGRVQIRGAGTEG